MPRKKLKRFEEIRDFDNVLEFPEAVRGGWRGKVFGNEGEIVLELACGKGAYSLELARRFAGKNFVGVDRKGERIWCGAKEALNEGLENVRFLRVFIEKLNQYFEEGEVDEIWITFADPFPRDGDEGKRLTAPMFLEMYKVILRQGGILHLKTDADSLYDYSLETLGKMGGEFLVRCDDVYGKEEELRELCDGEEAGAVLEIQTDFERRHLEVGRTIKYLKYRF